MTIEANKSNEAIKENESLR